MILYGWPFFVLLRDQDGRFSVGDGDVVYPWGELGILQSARTLVNPDNFAELVTDEAAQWDQSAMGIDSVIGGLLDKLDLSESWGANPRPQAGIHPWVDANAQTA